MSAIDMPRTVLLPVNLSVNCERAFKWYVKRARLPQDKIILLHVVKSSVTSHYELIAFTSHGGTEVEKSVDLGKDILNKYKKLCKAESLPHTSMLAGATSIGNTIVTVANEEDVSLIIMTSRGSRKAKRALLGDNTSSVINNSGVPVLVVPPAKRSTVSFTAEADEAQK